MSSRHFFFRLLVWGTVALMSQNVMAQGLELLDLPVVERPERDVFFDTAAEQVGNSSIADSQETSTQDPNPIPLSDSIDFIGEQAINVQELRIGLKSVGAPYEDGHRFDSSLWQQVQFASLVLAMKNVSGSAETPLSTLLRDLLLADTALPKDTSEQEFLEFRARTLARLGMIKDALRLLNTAETLSASNLVLRDELRVQLYDTTDLCPRPQQRLSALVQQYRILCLLVANKPHEAALQAQLMQEVFPETAQKNYYLLAQLAVTEEPTLPPGETLMADAFSVLMAQESNVTPRFVPDAEVPPAVGRMLLEQPFYPLNARLLLAEKAYEEGFATAADVRRIQIAQDFPRVEYKNALGLLEQFPSEQSRALALQVLADQPQLPLLLAALHHGDVSGKYALMLDLLRPTLDQFRTEKSLALARAHLGTGALKQSLSALPERGDSATYWVLHQVLSPTPDKTVSRKKQPLGKPSNNTTFLQSLILDDATLLENDAEETPQTTAVASWQDWYFALRNNPRQREMILSLLPVLGVSANVGTPTPLLENSVQTSENPGLRLINLLKWLRVPTQDLKPAQVARALHELQRLGYDSTAKAMAVRLLATFLRPVDQ